MLPVQPYHEGSYPPGVRFPQFGDDVVGGFLNAHDALAQKRRNMVPFHIGRLAEDGFLPMHVRSHALAPSANPEDQATEALAIVRRPSFLPQESFESASEATMSPPPSPRGPSTLARVRRAGFDVASTVGQGTAQLAMVAGNASMRATSSGLGQLQNVGGVAARVAMRATSSGLGQLQNVGSATARATSSSASHLRDNAVAAMEPGSNTRRAIAATASSTASVLAAGASGAKQAMEFAGPPVVHGAYAAAEAGRQLGTAGLEAAGTAYHYIGEHIAPAVHSITKRGAEFALETLTATVLHGGDILRALDEFKPQHSAHNALENGRREAITYGAVSGKKRDRSPQARFHSGSASSSSTQARGSRPEVSYDSTQEWLEYSNARGVLVEELYKRPNWRSFITVTKEKDELRKKLLKMSPEELAEILVKLDNM